jgi:hypothetical protein
MQVQKQNLPTPETEASIFDIYMQEVEKRAKQFVVRLSDRPSFVFGRDDGTEETRRITEEANKNVRLAVKGEIYSDWKELAGKDHMAIGRAVHMAERHRGFMVEKWVPCEEPTVKADGFKLEGDQWCQKVEVFKAERWSVRQFLSIARRDPQAFMQLMEGLNDQLGVGMTSDDVAYFQEEAGRAEGEPLGAPTASSG